MRSKQGESILEELAGVSPKGVRVKGETVPSQDYKEGSPILIVSPELASSHDSNGLLFIESALTFHFSVSGFAHNIITYSSCNKNVAHRPKYPPVELHSRV